MKPIILLLAVIAQGFAPFAFAQSDRSDARQLLSTMKYDEQVNVYVSNCLNSGEFLSAEEIFESNPNAFHGITPRSKYWPEVVRLLTEHYEECCNSYSAEQLLDQLAGEYSKHLSSEEIRGAIAFF